MKLCVFDEFDLKTLIYLDAILLTWTSKACFRRGIKKSCQLVEAVYGLTIIFLYHCREILNSLAGSQHIWTFIKKNTTFF